MMFVAKPMVRTGQRVWSHFNIKNNHIRLHNPYRHEPAMRRSIQIVQTEKVRRPLEIGFDCFMSKHDMERTCFYWDAQRRRRSDFLDELMKADADLI